MKKLISQLIWFVVVGSTAAATHWLAAVAAVAFGAIPPAIANFIGWQVALVVSFGGHYTLTFRHQPKALLPAIRRFLCISAAGFAVNEAAFVLLLDRSGLPYYWLLAIILLAVAALTFIFSRYWAFSHKI